MGRSGGLIAIVIALVCSAALFAAQWPGGDAPTGGDADRTLPVQRASSAAAQTAQVLAERELAAYQATHRTFGGATISDISGVTVRSADATRYCLQVVTNGVALYDGGPDGSLSPTPCA